MSGTYTATIAWQRRPAETFTDGKFNRAHNWSFDGGLQLPASASPHVVRGYSDPAGIDPEEALVASLSSCHMLTFLYYAAKRGLVVDSYTDTAEGVMSKNEKGKLFVSQVTLRPHTTWAARVRIAPLSTRCTIRRTRNASSPIRCGPRCGANRWFDGDNAHAGSALAQNGHTLRVRRGGCHSRTTHPA